MKVALAALARVSRRAALAARLVVPATLACATSPGERRPHVAPATEPAAGSSNEAASIQMVSYPPGRWRLGSPQSLVDAVLWVSHILIRHSGSDRQVPGTVAIWNTSAPTPPRQRTAALALATELAEKAGAHPERFSELAREHSEDESTRSLGGSLGGVRASDLMFEPELLDALAVLHPGEVSRVIETQHGFHILHRRPPPNDARVSGNHLVVSHEAVRWLQSVGATVSRRSHSEAVELAANIYRQAQAAPERFRDLIAQYSEHPDKAVGGDMGSWSVREPTHYPRAVERLAALSEGEIAPPIESYYGLEIVQRTPDRARERYAMEAIQLAFTPGDEASKQAALGVAIELTRRLRAEPERFDELRAQYCCPGVEAWWEGRDEPGTSAAVAALSLGQIAESPLTQYVNIVIPRRVAPEAAPPVAPPSFEVPAPERPDLDWLWQIARPLLERELLAAAAEEPEGVLLTPEQRRGAENIVRAFVAASSSPGEAPPIAEMFESLEEQLGLEKVGKYRARFEERLGQRFLDASSGLRQVEL